MLNSNIEKLKIFIEVTRVLNKHGITPILFGSLGLYKVIDKLERKINDIDILVPDEFLCARWVELFEIVNKLGFVLKDEHEHEFVSGVEIIAFGKASDLVKIANVDFEKLKVTNKDEAEFGELFPEQYLNCYKFMLRDNYRQEKRGNADNEKIALIEKYLQERNIKNQIDI